MKLAAIFLISVCAFAAAPTTDIKVDQVGYLPHSPKLAMVVSHTSGKGVLRAPRRQRLRGLPRQTGGACQRSRFRRYHPGSGFHEAGKARQVLLEVPGVGRSWDFAIGPDVFARAFYLAMRSFYGQRCGTAVDLGPEFPGYKHAACHLEGAYHVSSGKTGPHVSAKGWHDAGDYGRYVVNSGISTGTLLWTWEIFGNRLKQVKLDIPESGNGTPDILNEIRWNLDWMLSMQDDDGGVWHKQTSERFCDFIMPEKDTLISYVIGTWEGALQELLRHRRFRCRDGHRRPRLPALRCRLCGKMPARRAPGLDLAGEVSRRAFHNPPGVSTGDYGDGDCADEHLWAAAELWRTTGDQSLRALFSGAFRRVPQDREAERTSGLGEVAPLALWTYALGHGKNAEAVAAITQDSATAAQQIAERSSRHPYRISLTPRITSGDRTAWPPITACSFWWPTRCGPIPALWRRRWTTCITCWAGIPFRYPG
jgi:endoglucanase